MGFRFESLEIWHMARRYATTVYELTERLPRKEDFGLTTQLNRAVYSISLNIAEGSGRDSDKELTIFLE
jgi:four helix bundle protein